MTMKKCFSRSRRAGNRALSLATALAALAVPATGHANDITFAVIGPHEYDLPVNFKPFNAFVQYGEVADQGQSYDANGNAVKGPGGQLAVGLTKYVRFFTVDALPKMGFGFQVIAPEVSNRVGNMRYSGMGDPLVGLAMWIKPDAHTTLGVQTLEQAPVGTAAVSGNSWNNLSSVFYDRQWQHFSLTGNTGVVLRGKSYASGAPVVDQGNSIHSSLRVGLKASARIEPFLAVDYQSTGSSHLQSGAIAALSSNETTLGGGAMLTLFPSTSLTVRYDHAVDGRNIVQTDTVYFKLAFIN